MLAIKQSFKKMVNTIKELWSGQTTKTHCVCILVLAFLLEHALATIGIYLNNYLSRHEQTEVGWRIISFISVIIMGFLGLGWYYQNEKSKKLIKEMEKLVNHLSELSVTDELTGALNRRGMIDRIEQEMGRSKRFNRKFGIMSFDIDKFKLINDYHGHQVGDEILILLAKLVLEVIRSVDKLGRLGGDEFFVLSPESDLEKTIEIAERIRHKIAEHDSKVKFTISIGVAEYDPTIDQELDELLRNADESLYRAKSNGRNRVEK